MVCPLAGIISAASTKCYWHYTQFPSPLGDKLQPVERLVNIETGEFPSPLRG